jgi:hypothetical protein
MSTCTSCGCSPCACSPSVINQPQIIGGVFDGPTVNGPTINGGQANNLVAVGLDIDCTSRACTQPPGICDESVANTAFVCAAIVNAISGSNPAFCAAIEDCLIADPAVICPAVVICINTTPGIINSTTAFGPGARATDLLFGVVRFATITEVQNGACNVALEPCDLLAVWGVYNPVQPFWISFCAAIGSCGYAPLASPIFTGDPQAPTAAPGDNDTSIATTAFVTAAIAAAAGVAPTCASITALFADSGGNPGAGVRFLAGDCNRYTAAQIVAGGGGGGGGGIGVAFALGEVGVPGLGTIFTKGCTNILGIVTFTVPQPDTQYSVVYGGAVEGVSVRTIVTSKTVNGFSIATDGVSITPFNLDFVCVR